MKSFKWATTAVAAGALAFVASADTETPWFSVNFDNATTWAAGQTQMAVTGGTFDKATTDDNSQLIDSTSESAKATYVAQADGNVLELNTEGNELTFNPTTVNPGSNSDLTVIEADVFFIASDTAPALTDSTIQVALYLKAEENETPVFQAYSDVDGNPTWVDLGYDLTNVDVSNGIWRKIQIVVDKVNNTATYSFGAKGGTVSGEYTKALANVNEDRPAISSVSFKGTGLVDNFVGAVRTVETLELTYAATVNGSDASIVNVGPSDSTSVSFTIPVSGLASGDTVTLTKIQTKTYSGEGKTYTVNTTGNEEDGYAVTLTDENNVVTTPIAEGEEDFTFNLAVDVSSFLEGYSEDPGTPIVAIEVWYGEEAAPTEFPTQAEFEAAMADVFAGVGGSDPAELAIDPTDGVSLTFTAPYDGIYQLVSATTVDGSFTTVVDEEDAEEGDEITLTDANTTPSAKFYKVKLVDPNANN